ncbi:oligopeptide transport system ATP-binding protein [Halorubrum aquaticum]|uniref:Oligopeptide transport system ATP-binding protein n=1 Tax=Halorubrum aquaticum TaxID=387340 RepID=A0A1I3ABQ1_9EURY|nr:oligopeptide/dipeptide ABC transporter ATP-binding protein [Halorubrum aquaticum]SFH47139.1 oligopeptide transport system ATP-binding protein [Halorubrum aquaticum]
MSTDSLETSTTPAVESIDEPLLRATGLQKYFQTETGLFDRFLGEPTHVKAVDGVDVAVGERETLGLVGESGCGKTTLGRVLSRLYDPSAGTLEFDGEDITDLEGAELKRLRKRVQVIFQDPMSSLNPRKTAGEIVAKPLEVHDIATGEEKQERLAELFDEVGLQESHLDRYPHEFSGGQRQRIGIARALAVEPDLIIADEPVSALDVSVQAQIINLMKRLQDKYGLSYVFIAHDLSVVKHISDRVAVMYLGKIVEQGRKEDIFGNPQHPYTRALLHSIPRVDGKRKRHESLLEGNPPSPIDPPSGCRFRTRCPEYLGDECADTEPELRAVAGESGTVAPPERVEMISTDGESSDEHAIACHWLGKSSERREEQDPMT